ncbi:MAG: FliH/SctL family protein [Sedimentibacter sp.]|uniref:FliH/SctL family protein n=1 Tax=Sedimentibacter sp. TaxID=1960295 RepID=UPI0029829877|nr:FliH/SctL family protein [Sedimentibacter sp.]MDW5298749.1 FliH/SctL family protein [Sedimentibacter sp.]
MSNIIKAEYVIFDDKKINRIKKEEFAEQKSITTPREDLYEIYNQREIILKEANEEALKIINAAKRNVQTEIAELKKRGFEEGYNAGMEIGKNKGYEEGYELGKLKITEKLNKQNKTKEKEITNMLEEIENKKENIISTYERGLSKLAIDIAEKIIRQKIELQGNIVTRIIESVIKDYRNEEWVKVYISSKDDAKSIRADKDLIQSLSKISNDVKIEVSEELEEGSAIVETPEGIVDASIITQLNNLKEMVLSKND